MDVSSAAVEAVRRIRGSQAFARLSDAERRTLTEDLGRIERTLLDAGNPAAAPPTYGAPRSRDPYALPLATPADLNRQLSGAPGGSGNSRANAPPAAPAPAPAPTNDLTAIGGQTADVLEAVNFPGFVAGLVTGTFQAIVDATSQQLREYSELVGQLSRSVSDFARDNVSPQQTREWLTGKYPNHLTQVVPRPGEPGEPQLVPRDDVEGQSPEWLAQFGLSGANLSPELTEGALLQAGRESLGEERLQSLATMVLMGLNRVVVNDGEIRARMQFHARASHETETQLAAGVAQQGAGIAGRQIRNQSSATMMVSTLKSNLQAESSIKADLMGEVRISFRTETFPLERFADSGALQLLNRHARWVKPSDAAHASTASGGSSAPRSGGSEPGDAS